MLDISKSKALAGDPIGYVHAPVSLLDKYPHGVFLKVEGAGMSRVVPDGADILIDPDTEPVNGAVVGVEMPDGKPYVRRWYRGADTLLLTADGYEGREDMVFKGDEIDELLVLGTVVWYQASGDVK